MLSLTYFNLVSQITAPDRMLNYLCNPKLLTAGEFNR